MRQQNDAADVDKDVFHESLEQAMQLSRLQRLGFLPW